MQCVILVRTLVQTRTAILEHYYLVNSRPNLDFSIFFLKHSFLFEDLRTWNTVLQSLLLLGTSVLILTSQFPILSLAWLWQSQETPVRCFVAQSTRSGLVCCFSSDKIEFRDPGENTTKMKRTFRHVSLGIRAHDTAPLTAATLATPLRCYFPIFFSPVSVFPFSHSVL